MHEHELAHLRDYPNLIGPGHAPENDLVHTELLKEIGGGPGRVLDVGCNSGWLLRELRARGFEVMGVDPARLALERCWTEGLPCLPATAEALPFKDSSFDVITVSSVLQQVPDVEPAMRSMARVLKPGGRMIGINPMPAGDWGTSARGKNPYVVNVLPPDLFGYYLAGLYRWRQISPHAYLWSFQDIERPGPSIGVVMPVVNCLKYTQQAVRSLVMAGRPYEIILIDNGSTDGTQAWFAGVDRPVVYLRQETNLGVSPAWNLGIATAFERGHEVVFVVNNDLVFAPDTVARLLAWLRQGLEFLTVSNIGASPDTLATHARRELVIEVPNFSGFLTTRSVIGRVGWFDEGYRLAYFEDLDYHERLKQEGVRALACVDAVVAHYGSRTRHEGGVNHEPFFSENRQRFVAKWGYDPLRVR